MKFVKSNRVQRLLVFFFAILGLKALMAAEYRRSFPEMPRLEDPARVIDLYSYALAYQIHATLFRFDHTYLPRPYLVESFTVSADQLTYDFRLRAVHFHDGNLLTADHVTSALEHAVRSGAINHEGLKFLRGFEWFEKRKAPHISGLSEVVGTRGRVVRMELRQPDPDLLNKLTDLNLAIWNSKAGVGIGLGPYRIDLQSPTVIVLKRFYQKELSDTSHGPETVRLSALSMGEALRAFELGQIDDLFFYPVSDHHLGRLQSKAHIQRVVFPRTYYVALNARRIKKADTRRKLLRAISVPELVSKCFPKNQPTTDLIPPGFSGYTGKNSFPTPDRSPLKMRSAKPLRISIAEAIGEEECLRTHLDDTLGKVVPIKLSIEPITKIAAKWRSSQLDGFVAFMEGETTLHYFGVFSPDSSFPLGVPRDNTFMELFSEFLREDSPERRHTLAASLAQHILEQGTILPLFHPTVYLVYSRRFKPIPTPFQSAALLPLTELNEAASERAQ